MRNVRLIANRELIANIRTKGFWFAVVINPLLLVAFIVVPILLSGAKTARRYAVVDNSGWLLPAIDQRAAERDAERLIERWRIYSKQPQATPEGWPAPLLAMRTRIELGDPDKDGALAGELARDPSFVSWWRQTASQSARTLRAGTSLERFERVAVPAGSEPEPELRKLLEQGDDVLFAYFVIAKDPLDSVEGQKYVSNNLTDESLASWFREHAGAVVRNERIKREGLDPEVIARLDQSVTFESKKVSDSGEEAEVSVLDQAKQWAPAGFTYLLWISVFATASMLMNGIVEEKSNKLIEALLSCVSPMELMSGKVLGIAATGLTLVAGWVVMYFGLFLVLPVWISGMRDRNLADLVTQPAYLFSFLVYFVLGYLMYGAILLALGSLCSSPQDAQNMMGPVVMLLLLPLIAMMPVVQDPNGLIARVLSYIPLFTPFTMMNRAAGPPSWWEYVLTTLLLIGTVYSTLWAAAKVFRIGILMTGKPPRPKELWRIIRTA
jgi:ABC-2 type transport system permease protein